MNLDFKEIIILGQFVVIIFLLFGVYKSVPPEFVRIVMGYLERKATETPDPKDDEVVAEVNRIVEALLAAKQSPTVNTINVSPPPVAQSEALPGISG